MVAKASSPAKLPHAILLSFSKAGATKGLEVRDSMTKKATHRTAAMTSGPHARVLPHPSCPVASMPSTNVMSASVIVIAPGISNFGRCSAVDGSRSTKDVAKITETAITTLMKKVQREETVAGDSASSTAPVVKPAVISAIEPKCSGPLRTLWKHCGHKKQDCWGVHCCGENFSNTCTLKQGGCLGKPADQRGTAQQ